MQLGNIIHFRITKYFSWNWIWSSMHSNLKCGQIRIIRIWGVRASYKCQSNQFAEIVRKLPWKWTQFWLCRAGIYLILRYATAVCMKIALLFRRWPHFALKYLNVERHVRVLKCINIWTNLWQSSRFPQWYEYLKHSIQY